MKIGSLFAVALLCAMPALSEAQSSKGAGGGVDILRLIETVAKSSGKTFVIDPRIRGDVQTAGLDPDKVTYPQLQTILRINQFVAIEEAGIVNILPDVNARQMPTVTLFADDPALSGETLVTWVVQVRNVCAPMLVPILRPLMPQQAHMAAYPPTNTLILADRLANLRRIVGIAERVDKSTTGKQDCGEKKEAGAK
jgi:general secretion pathway protein D